jgi:hypothetical protein
MQLSAILLARVIAFFEVADITPHGGLFFPDIVKELVQRFSFQKYPRTLDEWNDSGGSQFRGGKLGSIAIDTLILFNNGIQVDTHADTTESKNIIEQTLEWGNDKFGLSYKSGIIKRWAYVSDLTFTSDVPILSNRPVDNLAERTTRAISDILGHPSVYVPTTLYVGHDPLTMKHGRASFRIERKIDFPFSDNRYFSEAPLPTDMHISLLEQYEKDVAENV